MSDMVIYLQASLTLYYDSTTGTVTDIAIDGIWNGDSVVVEDEYGNEVPYRDREHAAVQEALRASVVRLP